MRTYRTTVQLAEFHRIPTYIHTHGVCVSSYTNLHTYTWCVSVGCVTSLHMHVWMCMNIRTIHIRETVRQACIFPTHTHTHTHTHMHVHTRINVHVYTLIVGEKREADRKTDSLKRVCISYPPPCPQPLQTDRQTDKQTDRPTDPSLSESYRDRQTGIHTDRQTHRDWHVPWPCPLLVHSVFAWSRAFGWGPPAPLSRRWIIPSTSSLGSWKVTDCPPHSRTHAVYICVY